MNAPAAMQNRMHAAAHRAEVISLNPLPISLTVNGRPVNAEAEPRMLLSDFLRDELRLTGLHLACEHGVCGACNVEIDGQLSRSCTQLAARCDGRQIRTVEGFDDDVLMERLRAAFSAEHALQCGYCTPGMLMTARDIVRRFPRPDEATVRRELSGNLCRCTGYAGIVRAVLRVAGERDDWSVVAAPLPSAATKARAMGLDGHVPHEPVVPVVAYADAAAPASAASGERIPDPMPLPAEGSANTITRSFSLPAPREDVWRFFGDVRSVAACMPGFEVQDVQEGERLRGVFTVKAGPIRAVFSTIARITRDSASWSGRVESEGRDRLTRSATLARLDYRLEPRSEGAGTDIHIGAAFHIEGRLAEFSRPEIVAGLATQLTERFAANVEQRLVKGEASADASSAALELSPWSVLQGWLQQAGQGIAMLLRRLFMRR